MKTTLTIAAIAMFAVILGMSAIAPAMATPGNPNSAATTRLCHFDEVEDDPETEVDESLDSSWIVLHTSSQGATNGHEKHGDQRINNDAEALACVTNQDGTVTTSEV